jgi:hypothetical protein
MRREDWKEYWEWEGMNERRRKNGGREEGMNRR